MPNTSKKRIKQVSSKQAKRNREMAKIKEGLGRFCVICGMTAHDPAHLLPRSTYPEHYTADWNVKPMCRACHDSFDNDLEFRQRQIALFLIVLENDKLGAIRYFSMDENLEKI